MSEAASDLFPPALVGMLNARVVQGRTRQVNFVGGSTRNNLFVLANLLRERRPQRTLEIGLACGASALAFAHAHRVAGGPDERIHVAIDPFQADLDDAALVQIESEGLDRHFRFMREPSYAALPQLLRDGERFDIIYIDGSHHFDHVFIDLFYAGRLLLHRGVVLFDDSTLPEVKKVIAFVRRNLAHALVEMDLTRHRRKRAFDWRYKLAGLMGRRQLTAFEKIADPQRSIVSAFKQF